MAKDQTKASLRPSDMTEGGGLLDDVDVTITEARFVTWDYQGKAAPVPALKMTMAPDEGDPVDQYWSVGKAIDWAPTPDGKSLVKIGQASALNVGSNFGILISSLINAGFPEDKLEEDIDILDGLQCHVIRVAAPKRTGLASSQRADGREATILTVDSIAKLPWEKGGGKSGGKGAGGKSGAKSGGGKAASAGDDAIEQEAQEVLVAMLADADGGSLKKAEIPVKAVKAASAANRSKVVVLLNNEDFLSRDGMPWKYEDGVVSLGY